MHRLKYFPFLALIFQIGTSASANQILWEDLIGKTAQTYEDPYVDLDYEKIDDLRTVAQGEKLLANSDLVEAERTAIEEKYHPAKSRLEEDGLDANWLISQRWVVAELREKAATAVNPELDGEKVTLDGFAIPAPPDADGTPVIYLVPERGMCSHMPPPNPNQMIRVRLSGDWLPRMMQEPVRLTGKLFVEETRHVFRIVDGDLPMRASFVMDAEQVEAADQLRNDFPTAEERAARLTGRARATGKLPLEKAETGN